MGIQNQSSASRFDGQDEDNQEEVTEEKIKLMEIK